jgi:predicted dehydrogenase
VKGFRIVAACDLDVERAKALAEPYKARCYTDVNEMLATEPLDVVDVVTQERDRLPPLKACLDARKHVYCEKPLAGKRGQYAVRWDDVQAAKPVIDAWKKAGTFFGINFNYRTSPPAMKIKAAIHDGTIGDLVAVNIRAHLACWSHVIDLMRWFCGDVAELSAYVSGNDEAANRSATLRFTNGVIGTLMGSTEFGWHHELLRIEVIGKECRAVMTDLCGRVEFFPAHQREVRIWELPLENWRADFGKTFTDSVVNYATAILAGKQPPVTGTDAMRELEIDAGIFVSAQTGKPFKPELYG